MEDGLVTVICQGGAQTANSPNSKQPKRRCSKVLLLRDNSLLDEYNVFLFMLLCMNPAPNSRSIIFIACIYSKHGGFPLKIVEL